MTEKSDLIEEAKSLGVDVKTSWTIDRLKVEIVKARQSTPAQVEQIDSGSDDRMRRFTALDAAERVGVAVGDDWSTGQIEEAVRVVTEAANVAPPRAGNADGYDEFPDGASSPRG